MVSSTSIFSISAEGAFEDIVILGLVGAGGLGVLLNLNIGFGTVTCGFVPGSDDKGLFIPMLVFDARLTEGLCDGILTFVLIEDRESEAGLIIFLECVAAFNLKLHEDKQYRSAGSRSPQFDFIGGNGILFLFLAKSNIT